ncbi:MAG: hypothetical protein A2W33_03750 [Chloroflexi bacterium RBG_16_52_11]|nr:MAG: hypothetical protein A2W33_03750 [Chloroflexi bacterium RBG_16_52_11]
MSAQSFNPGGLTELPFGLPGRVFRSPIPFGDRDRNGQLVIQYQLECIAAIVILVGDEEILVSTGKNLRRYYLESGYDVIHLPIPDYGVPDPSNLALAVSSALEHAIAGKHTVVHCNAGIGRTGMFLACLAKEALGKTGDEAIRWVRSFIPGAIENPGQLEMARSY